jgi:tetratricopeptide (TPR) repeat protein
MVAADAGEGTQRMSDIEPEDRESSKELEPLGRQVARLRERVDELTQSAESPRSVPANRLAVAVSVSALLFSFGTTLASYQRSELQDVQAKRQELRVLLQRLAALPKENLEVPLKYQGNHAVIGGMSGLINQENTFLSRQAADLARALPKDAVSAMEHHAIAVALLNAYDVEGAKASLKLAIARAKDFNTEIAALRVNGNLEFIQGNQDAARKQYELALVIFDKYPIYDKFTRAQTHVLTRLAWATSEANFGVPENVGAQITAAEKIVEELPPSPGSTALGAQIAQARSEYEANGLIRSTLAPVPGSADPTLKVVPSVSMGIDNQ